VLTAAQRRTNARIAAYALAAQRDPVEYTAKARATFLARFENQVDPRKHLPIAERRRRAAAARKAHFLRLALASAKKP
jgi:hypothetical protein